ncbi:hypothetical protein HZS_925 [Henneguya salminicola]|nr:hypothetical protein HZS_925 [Henneguya salminicola]
MFKLLNMMKEGGRAIYINLIWVLLIYGVFTTTTGPIITEPEIMVYREMKLIIYGATKLTVPETDSILFRYNSSVYYIDISINDILLCTSDIAISGHEFRAQEVLNDYIILENGLFTKSLTVKIELYKINEKNKKTTILDSEIKIVPNDEISVLGNDDDVFNFSHIIFRLSCHGYTGFNCQYFESEEEKLITEFYSGILICKDPIKCGQGMILHATIMHTVKITEHVLMYDEINLTDRTQYCSCLEGWSGPTCNDRECAFDEEEYYFGIILFLTHFRRQRTFLSKKRKL